MAQSSSRQIKMKKYEIHKKRSEDVTHLISRLLGSLFHVMSLASAISASWKKKLCLCRVYREIKLLMVGSESWDPNPQNQFCYHVKKTGSDFYGTKWTIGSLSCFRKVMMYDIPGYLVVGNVGWLHEGDQRSQIVQSGQLNLHHVASI